MTDYSRSFCMTLFCDLNRVCPCGHAVSYFPSGLPHPQRGCQAVLNRLPHAGNGHLQAIPRR